MEQEKKQIRKVAQVRTIPEPSLVHCCPSLLARDRRIKGELRFFCFFLPGGVRGVVFCVFLYLTSLKKSRGSGGRQPPRCGGSGGRQPPSRNGDEYVWLRSLICYAPPFQASQTFESTLSEKWSFPHLPPWKFRIDFCIDSWNDFKRFWMDFGTILASSLMIWAPCYITFSEHRFWIDLLWIVDRLVRPPTFKNPYKTKLKACFRKISVTDSALMLHRFCDHFSWFVDHFGIIFIIFSASILVSIFALFFNRFWFQTGSQNRSLGDQFQQKGRQKWTTPNGGFHPFADPAPQDPKNHTKSKRCWFLLNFASILMDFNSFGAHSWCIFADWSSTCGVIHQ